MRVDTSRQVEVVVAANNAEMPWEFYPMEYSVDVHPGESRAVNFFAHNTTSEDMVAQAIPNALPNNAADYFHKTAAFVLIISRWRQVNRQSWVGIYTGPRFTG